MQRVLLRRIAAIGGALTLASIACHPAWAQPAPAEGPRFGKRMVAEYELPPETIAQFASLKRTPPDKHESALVNALLTQSVDWKGPILDVRTADNPYTIVVTVNGVPTADGDAATMWTAGWQLTKGDFDDVRKPLAGLTRPDARGGEKFVVTAAAMPTSFKEDGRMGVVLGLVDARNVTIESVRVQLWSGLPSTTWLEAVGAFRWALVGVVMLVLWWFWFRRRSD
jgi:hypothetical protein